MIAAIAGDIIGSVHERASLKRTTFTLFKRNSSFTDDTVLTAAVADSLLGGVGYEESIRTWARRYPRRGYGGMFRKWMKKDDAPPYNSFGNGSAMRVSPVGFAFHRRQQVLDAAAESAAVTHNHPEGIKGAQAVALAIFLARKGSDKATIRSEIQRCFRYDLKRSVDQIRPRYRFDVTCQGSVPEAIIAFLDSDDVESALRLAISLGGDADTQACIAGGIAQAFYAAIPEAIITEVEARLTPDILAVVRAFETRYDVTYERI